MTFARCKKSNLNAATRMRFRAMPFSNFLDRSIIHVPLPSTFGLPGSRAHRERSRNGMRTSSSLWLNRYPRVFCYPAALLTGFEAASLTFGPDPQEDPMQESVFGRRFVRLMEEELRRTLVSKFHDHKYVFGILTTGTKVLCRSRHHLLNGLTRRPPTRSR